MKIEQIYTGCLAEAAYYIESNGEVAIVDPLRETAPYLERAERDGAKIKYILETHFHADFVSGHLDLALKTGAQIVFGPTAQPAFQAYVAKDNEDLKLGNITIRVLHTPGHTMESSTFLLIDEQGKPHSIFTGDTLFIGDVGRPDLAVKSDLSREDLAGHLYDSLQNKILTLPNEVIIYPGHGAGSACGKNMSKETVDTLGHQKESNYALQPMSKEEFVYKVTEGLVAPPQYFPKNAVMNKMGYTSFDAILEKGLTAFSPQEFLAVKEATGALVIDTRSSDDFAAAHIPGAWFIGIDGSFAPWVGALISDLNTPIIYVADEGKEEEVVTRLARVGYDHSLGYLKGGMNSWTNEGFEVSSLEQISAPDFADRFETEKLNLVDVRKKSEYDSEHLLNAENYPLDFIFSELSAFSSEKTYYIHCAGGYRSAIACSILSSKGFKNVINIKGGFTELSKTGLRKSEYVCPSTML